VEVVVVKPITREHFEAAVGRGPVDDDLERCNCPHVGDVGHSQCGWNFWYELPNFMCLDRPDRPAACVPDDQPETYAARRKRIAAERNPHARRSEPYVPSQGLLDVIRRYKDAVAHQQTDGIGRAVRNLSQVEHRVGAARLSPEGM
jgi:hypothetical protein